MHCTGPIVWAVRITMQITETSKSKCKCEEKKSIILKICADPTKKVYGDNKGLKLKLRLNRNNSAIMPNRSRCLRCHLF